MKTIRGVLAILIVSLWSPVPGQSESKAPVPTPNGPAKPSKPLPNVPVAWPPASGTASVTTSSVASNLFKQSVNMKLLVLSADGTDPAFEAIKFFLDHIGIPYDAVVLTKAPLPPLTDLTHGLYQGIVLSNGTLPYNGASKLLPADWIKLDDYQRAYGVRVVSYYTFPEARYGLALSGAGQSNTPVAPAKLSLTTAGSSLFPYLIAANQLDVVYSWYYPSTPVAAIGETTTPIMTISGPGVTSQTVGVTHTAADGRETLAMTFDSSPYLIHSLALNYGIFNWVTKGVFIGQRKIFLTPQSDDFFLANDMFTTSPAACKPPGFNLDPTYDPSTTCPTDRDSNGDLSALVNWQRNWQAKAQFSGFRLSHAFNGFGTTPDGGADKNDKLVAQAKTFKNDFFWLNHTWDHENLECYNPVPNSGICRDATYAESFAELQQNIALAKSLGIPNDATSMVTPNISGLKNMAFLQAAQASGIKYLVSDMSRLDWQPALPNTGVYGPAGKSILYIPRRATNIFYNTESAYEGDIGSLTDEYNYFYGPTGLLRVGGPGGPPFYTTKQTYDQIIDAESNALLTYMLRGEWYPSMYHQSNLIRYNGNHSLYSDLMDATLNKFSKISNLPVSSLAQTTIGQMMEDRMAFNAAGVKAVYVPSQGITMTASSAAKAPVTGVCATTGCSSYGGQSISMVPVAPSSPTKVPLY